MSRSMLARKHLLGDTIIMIIRNPQFADNRHCLRWVFITLYAYTLHKYNYKCIILKRQRHLRTYTGSEISIFNSNVLIKTKLMKKKNFFNTVFLCLVS